MYVKVITENDQHEKVIDCQSVEWWTVGLDSPDGPILTMSFDNDAYKMGLGRIHAQIYLMSNDGKTIDKIMWQPEIE